MDKLTKCSSSYRLLCLLTLLKFNLTQDMAPMPPPLDGVFYENNSDWVLTNDSTTTMSYPPFFYMYPPFEMIDSVLDGSQVREFLSGLPTETHRILVRNQLRYCPYVPLCNISIDLLIIPPMFPYGTCCQECSCDSDCFEKKTCCPDILPEEHIRLNNESIKTINGTSNCFSSSLSDPDDLTTRIVGIAYCPQDTDIFLAANCTRQYSPFEITSLEEVLPLYDFVNDISYRNMWCAKCHGIDPNNLRSFKADIMCSFPPTLLKTTGPEFLSAVLGQNVPCNIKLYDPDTRQCNNAVNECNKTGYWKEYNLTEHIGCIMYSSTIKAESWSTEFSYWQNVHCALCNGMESFTSACLAEIQQPPSAIYPFSSLLNFREFRTDTKEKPGDGCNKDKELYDNVTDTCIEFFCSPLRSAVDGLCKPLGAIKRTYSMYELSIQLIPDSPVTVRQILTAFEEGLRYFIEIKLTTLFDFEYASCEQSFVVFTEFSKVNTFAEIEDNLNLSVSFLYNTVNIYIEMEHKSETLFKVLTTADGFYFHFHSISSMNLTFLAKFVSTYRLHIPTSNISFGLDNINSLHNLDNLNFSAFVEVIQDSARLQYKTTLKPTFLSCPPFSNEVTEVWKIRPCRFVKLNLNSLEWRVTNEGILLKENDITLSWNEFSFADDELNEILMCENIYFKVYLNSGIKGVGGRGLDTASVFSLVCVGISLLGAVITLAVYVLLPSLRTMPGKNIISLTMALMLAQVSYLIGSYGGFQKKSFACQTFGLLTHWSWMLTFFWMNICTYHTFRVLTKTRPMRLGSGWKRLVIYHTYGFLSASLVVSVNIIYTAVLGTSDTIGYGRYVCYLDSQLMVGLTFGLPLGLILVANFAMFLKVIIQVKRASVVQKNVTNERNDISVFIKLSTLTGLMWIIGFIQGAVNFPPLSYVFIVLNGSQGMLVCLSFAVNQRVFQMFKKRFHPETSTHVSGTGSTKF